jgi:hypothetical protein
MLSVGGVCVKAAALKLGIALLAVCATGLLLLGPVQAQSIGVSPGIVEMVDVVRDGEYMRTMTLINHTEEELTFEVAREGEVAQWASLHAAMDEAASMDSIVVPANGSTRFLLRVTVPPDAPNGSQEGTVSFKTTVAERDAAGAARVSVNTGVIVQLKAMVTGDQKLSGAVLDVYTDDVEVGQPLVIKTKFQNTGNVSAQPEIGLKVKNSGGAVVGEASYGDAAVGPGQTQTIESAWDTAGKDIGSYLVDVVVSLDGNQIHAQEVAFELVEVGSLRGQGELEKLTLENSPQPGGVAEVAARFRNTAHNDTRAAFVAEIYYGDQLLDAVTTDEESVPSGETVAIRASLDVPYDGEYTVRGNVAFEGRRTESKEITFRVGAGEGLPLWAWIVIGGGVLAVVAPAGWVLRRRWLRKGAV